MQRKIALDADEIQFLRSRLLSWDEMQTLTEEELDSLKFVYHALLDVRRVVSPMSLKACG